MTDDLSAQGSGLRARQTKGSPHAPGKTHSDASSKPQIVDLHFLAQGLEETGSLFVEAVPRGCVRTWRLSQAGRHDADHKPRRTLAEMMMMCIY